MDPAINISTAGNQIDEALYDRLVASGPRGQFIPYLATSWKETPTSMSFVLRKDATCADGTPVTATVVANSFKRTMGLSDPKVKQFFVLSFFGPGPYTLLADDSAGTFTVNVGTPKTGKLSFMATPWSSIVCPAGLANSTAIANQGFGSGPFTLDSAVHGVSVTMKARPDWHWGPNGATAKSAGFPQSLVYKVVTNDTTAANLLTTGGLDLGEVAGPDVQRLAADHSLIHKSAQGFGLHALVFREAAGHATLDPTFRKALITAVDPKAWLQAAWSGDGITSPIWVTPDVPCYDKNNDQLMPSPDLTRAASTLLSNGYTKGNDGSLIKNGKQATITVVGENNEGSGPAYLADQFTKLGFKVTLSQTDQASWVTKLLSGDWDVATLEMSTPYPDIALNVGLLSGANTAFLPISDPAADAAVNRALQTGTCSDWSAAQAAMLQGWHLRGLAAPYDEYFGRGWTFQPDPVWLQVWSIRQA